LQGDFELSSADGQSIFRGNKTALCRCGSSANKPFCDGTHKEIEFQG
jgi:CDGSH-type Zn-finger protein